MKDEFDITVTDVEELIHVFKKLSGGQKNAYVIDARNTFGKVPEEVKKMAAKHPGLNDTRKATAILINSLANKILSDFYIRVFKPVVPTKVFTDEERAIKWLMDLDKRKKKKRKQDTYL